MKIQAEIDSFEKLHKAIQKYGRKVMVYRGEKSLEHELIPKIGRYAKFNSKNIQKAEKKILFHFRSRSLPFHNLQANRCQAYTVDRYVSMMYLD